MVIGLTHIHQLDTLYKSYGSRISSGVIWGHRGQKVIFTKNAISPTDYMPWSWNSYIFISYIPSTKVMGLEIQSGSFGVTGSKGHFYQKCYFSFRLHGMVIGLMHIHQLDTLYKVMGLEFHPGSFGVTGVKRSFSPKCYFSFRLHGMVMGLMHIHKLDTFYQSCGS